MTRNAKKDDERIRESEAGGRRRSDGTGWEARIHLRSSLAELCVRCYAGSPDTSRTGQEADDNPAGGADLARLSAACSGSRGSLGKGILPS